MNVDPKKFKKFSIDELKRHAEYHKKGNFDEYWFAKLELDRRVSKRNFWSIKVPIWVTLILSIIFFILNYLYPLN